MSGRNAIISRTPKERKNESGRSEGWLIFILGMGLVVGMNLSCVPSFSWAADDDTSKHFSKSLEIPLQGESIPKKLTFPLYEQNNIQYFSAGLGKEERNLSYPPYPLKLIFVKGERAYLASVAVEVLRDDGTSLISIPGEEIQGPWLFLNLPVGKYIIKATDSGGTTVEKNVTLSTNTTSKVHFRWP